MNYEHEMKDKTLKFCVFGASAVAMGGFMVTLAPEATAQTAVSPTQDRGLYVVSHTDVPRTPLPGGIRHRDSGGIRQPDSGGIRQPMPDGIRQRDTGGIRQPMPDTLRPDDTVVPREPATTGSTSR